MVPTSSYVSTERTPLELDELCPFLFEATSPMPDVVPALDVEAVIGTATR